MQYFDEFLRLCGKKDQTWQTKKTFLNRKAFV